MSTLSPSVGPTLSPTVVRFLAGKSLAVFGHTMMSVAVGWEIYERTRSPLSLGLVGLAQVVPVVGLALVAGPVVDRYDRRTVAFISYLGLGLDALLLAWASVTQAPIAVVYALLFLAGVLGAFRSPSQAAILPNLVAKNAFTTANAWSSSAFEIASIAGPGLAGFLIAWLHGAKWLYVIDAGLELAMALVLLTVPPIRPPVHVGKPEPITVGLTFLRRTPLLLAAITLDMFAVLFGGAVALLPIYAKDILAVGPEGLGWLRAAPSIGALLMALITTRLPPWQKAGRTLLVVVAAFGVVTIGFGLSANFYLSLLMLFLSGVFDNVSVVIRLTLEQTLTPERLRGRVSAIHYVFIGLSNELGSFESGVTAEWFGATASVVGGGIVTIVVVLVVWQVWPALARIGSLNSLQREIT